jgi:vacuolar-type H+-ATPase subunit H
MTEISKILQKEEAQKKAVETAKKQAQTKIEEKKQALALAFSTAGITKEQEGKILEYKAGQTKEIKKTIETDFETQLASLKKKDEENSTKAVEYVIKSLSIEK